MRANSPERAVTILGAPTDSRTLRLFAFVSFIGHLALFGVMLYSPFILPERRYSPAAIQVSMVSLPPGPSTAKAPRPAPEPPAEVVPAAEPEPRVPQPANEPQPEPKVSIPEPAPPEPPAEAEVSVAPKPKAYKKKTSLKKKTYKPKKKVKKAIAKIEKKVDSRPDSVARAIEKLKKRNLTPPPGSKVVSGQSGAGGAAGGGWAGAKVGGELIDVYKAEIAVRIQKNWAFSEQLARGQRDLSAVIVLKILPNGDIGDTWFEKRSGNDLLDDSAFRAVQKSNPLPPLPKGYFRSFYVVGLIFTPEGIQ